MTVSLFNLNTTFSRHDLAPAVVAGFVGLCALGLRLPFVSGHPDSPDGIRLIRALSSFDIHDFSPHFPGYPLAVWLARLFPSFGIPGYAWSLLSAISAAIACSLVVILLRQYFSIIAAVAAGLLLAVQPYFVMESLRVGTDVLVLPWIIAALLCLGRRGASQKWIFAGGLFLGLGFGIRPSAFIWLAAIFCVPYRLCAISGVALGVAVWLVPTFALIGFESYWQEGWRFTVGHFTQWGGAALSESASQLFAGRLLEGAYNWLWLPLRLPGLILIFCAVLIAVRRSFNRFSISPVLAGIGAYALWIVVAQNPQHARHAMPLVLAALAWSTAVVVDYAKDSRFSSRGIGSVAASVYLMLALVQSSQLARSYSQSTPPPQQVAMSLTTFPGYNSLHDRVYASGDLAYFTWIMPNSDTRYARTMEQVRADVRSLPSLPDRVWVSTMVTGANSVSSVLSASREDRLAKWGSEAGIVSWAVDLQGELQWP